MTKRPRCGRKLRTGNLCNRRAGHPGWCHTIDYARQAITTAAWDAADPARRVAYNEAWYAANTERKAAIDAAWVKANPERKKARNQKRSALKKGATVVPFTLAELKARMASFGDACYYCALLGIVGPHECDDHVFPIKPRKGHKPGPHALRNLVPSCTKHNSEKHNKPPMEFITKLLLVR